MTKPIVNLQELQARIGDRAKSAPAHRFWGMYVHIIKLETLEAAYLAAKENGGSPGSDKVTFGEIEEKGRQPFLQELATELKLGTYRALPHRKVVIPKSNGKTRTISIAAIRDRVVQGAIKLILEPIFEADFSASSMGARPGRQAHQALQMVREGLMRGHHHVLDLDFSAFFDNITHHRVLEKVARRIQDDRVMAVLKWFLKGNGARGVPQGSPLSPLLANLVLNDLDHILDRGRGTITYVRYLDDIVVLARNNPKGRFWLARALQRIKKEAAAIGVHVNEEKTRVLTITDAHASFAFLGFCHRWERSRKSGKRYAFMEPHKKKVSALKERIKTILARNRHRKVPDAVMVLNPVLRGWVNYFKVGNSATAFSRVRQYVEKSIRRFAAKQRTRRGFGWKRWSTSVIYKEWNLYQDYKIQYGRTAVSLTSKRSINPI